MVLFPSAPKPRIDLGENSAVDETVDVLLNRDVKNEKDQRELVKLNSIKFNNSSYSGTDIKVLVHSYGSSNSTLRGDLDRVIAVYSNIQTDLLGLVNLANQYLTAGNSSIKTQVISDFNRTVRNIETQENSIQDTGLIQFIATSLAVVSMQVDPLRFSGQISQLHNFLGSLLSGWKQQIAALNTRTEELVNTKVLAELQTISISTYREKNPVRALGSVGVRGYVRGPRTVAGTMIFTVFDRNVLFSLLDTSSDRDDQFRSAIKDQLSPLDITITFANEYGALSRMTIFGVEFVSEGQTMSIEDIILEDVCQFVARDIDPITPVLNQAGQPYNQVLLNYNQAIAQGRSANPVTDIKASDLIGSEWDTTEQNPSGAITRFHNRNNPFK